MVRTFSSLACAIILSALSANLSAAAPQQRNQAAGYYRLMVGDFEVTAHFFGSGVRRSSFR
jgi:hypothetical protein